MADSDTITITIPGHPQPEVKRNVVAGGRGFRVDSREAKSYKAYVVGLLREVAPAQPWEGPIGLRAVFYRRKTTSYRKRDCWPTKKADAENCAKILLDCLTTVGIWKDDAQVCIEHLEKRFGEPERTELEIWRLGDDG